MTPTVSTWVIVLIVIFESLHYTTAQGLIGLLGNSNQPRGRGNLFGQSNNNNNNNNQNNPLNVLGMLNGNNYRPTTRPTYNNNMFNNGNGLDPDTKQKLEDSKGKLEDVLEKLKELNRLKEEQKKKEGQSTTTESNNNKDDEKKTDVNNNQQTEDNKTTEKPNNDQPDINNFPVKGKWKKLSKRKFMFQAQPVIPENEVRKNKTRSFVYYLD